MYFSPSLLLRILRDKCAIAIVLTFYVCFAVFWLLGCILIPEYDVPLCPSITTIPEIWSKNNLILVYLLYLFKYAFSISTINFFTTWLLALPWYLQHKYYWPCPACYLYTSYVGLSYLGTSHIYTYSYKSYGLFIKVSRWLLKSASIF